MSNNEEKEKMREWHDLRAYFVVDINYLELTTGVTPQPYFGKRKQDGGIIPLMKMRKMTKLEMNAPRNLDGTYLELKKQKAESLRIPADEVKLPNQYFDSVFRFLKVVAPKKAFRRVFEKLEAEHQLTLRPTMVYVAEGVFPTLDVAFKPRKQ